MQENPRTTGILAVAKANNLDIELVETIPATAPAEYKNINKLGKIPTFVGADGFVLTEAIAIYVYGMLFVPDLHFALPFAVLCSFGSFFSTLLPWDIPRQQRSTLQ